MSSNQRQRRRRGLARPGVAVAFIAPAAAVLGVWVVYPIVETIRRSLFDRTGDEFVGVDNYIDVVTDPGTRVALRNTAIWVLFAPAVTTVLALILTVAASRVGWQRLFKMALFLPLAVSLFAVGIVWRIMYISNPEVGMINAAISFVHDLIDDGGPLTRAAPSEDGVTGSMEEGFASQARAHEGDVVLIGLTRIPVEEVPPSALQGAVPPAEPGAVVGVVWRDFSPGGGERGVVEAGEVGLPGVTVELRDEAGRQIASAPVATDGSFRLPVGPEGGFVAVSSESFDVAPDLPNWLGPGLVTTSMIIAYIWASIGYGMLIIGANLAALPQSPIDAARVDGARDIQIFRYITVPFLRPAIIVTWVTQTIFVLKLFDLVLAIAPKSVQPDATVLAFEMWIRSFTGQNNFGLGAALATILLVLLLPFLFINVRRLRTTGLGT